MAGMTEALGSTKDRILQAALRLYNEHDPSSVTTAQLADEAGIAEGNLHYHFRRKADVVAGLFDRYEAAARALLDEQPAQWAQPFDLRRYQRSWFELIWAYRFLHRGSCQLGRLPPGLRTRGWSVQQDIQRHVRQTLLGWHRGGYLSLCENVDTLIANLWMVAHYWMDYLAMSRGATAPTQADLKWGMAQMEALCKPYFTLEGRRELDGRPLSE
jgi:AcrR family transcriptional regulator